jgi:hypothetical protein
MVRLTAQSVDQGHLCGVSLSQAAELSLGPAACRLEGRVTEGVWHVFGLALERLAARLYNPHTAVAQYLR